jgi:hypothetical protein
MGAGNFVFVYVAQISHTGTCRIVKLGRKPEQYTVSEVTPPTLERFYSMPVIIPHEFSVYM